MLERVAARANCRLPNVMMSKETVTRHTIALRKCLWQRAETESGTHRKDMRNHTEGLCVRATQSHRRMMHLRKKLLRERERERESRVVESTVESSRRVILRQVVIFHRIQFTNQSGVPASIIISPPPPCRLRRAGHSLHSIKSRKDTD